VPSRADPCLVEALGANDKVYSFGLVDAKSRHEHVPQTYLEALRRQAQLEALGRLASFCPRRWCTMCPKFAT
jgi:hypothetical protein